jgi:hypothetical protein
MYKHLPANLAHNMVASEDSMMRGNGHTNFCESCVKPVALGRLITTIFPRIYARTYYAHPRARVMSFSTITSRHVPLFCQVSPCAIHDSSSCTFIAHLLVTLCMCCNSKVLQVIERTLAQSHQSVSG